MFEFLFCIISGSFLIAEFGEKVLYGLVPLFFIVFLFVFFYQIEEGEFPSTTLFLFLFGDTITFFSKRITFYKKFHFPISINKIHRNMAKQENWTEIRKLKKGKKLLNLIVTYLRVKDINVYNFYYLEPALIELRNNSIDGYFDFFVYENSKNIEYFYSMINIFLKENKIEPIPIPDSMQTYIRERKKFEEEKEFERKRNVESKQLYKMKKVPGLIFPRIKKFSPILFCEIFKIKKYQDFSIYCDEGIDFNNKYIDEMENTVVTVRFNIPKEDIKLFPSFRKFSNYIKKFIKYNYKKNIINNKFPLETIINNIGFQIVYDYCPLKDPKTLRGKQHNVIYFFPDYGPLYDSLPDEIQDEIEEILDDCNQLIYAIHEDTFSFNIKNLEYKEIKQFETFINEIYFIEKGETIFDTLSSSEWFGPKEIKKSEMYYHLKNLDDHVKVNISKLIREKEE
ncbi:MAG: hypothetical protein MJ184_07045 [Treponema sp.]|uniref:hypothetical protein n=1 Tax=Treponema sp. TaxID=166 RepID=UPI00298DACB3|nr:hypothetical protein [Treponema sp.]MCQ2601102.1 hypothetical protein [Treponema sp.]